MDAAKVELPDAIDRQGLRRSDGHHSAKVMVHHVARLSGAEAAARAKTARALRHLPDTKAAFRAGQSGPVHLATGERLPADPDDETFRCSTIDGIRSNRPKRSPVLRPDGTEIG